MSRSSSLAFQPSSVWPSSPTTTASTPWRHPESGSSASNLGYKPVGEIRGVRDAAGILHAEVWARWVPEAGSMDIDLHQRLCESTAGVAWNALYGHGADSDGRGNGRDHNEDAVPAPVRVASAASATAAMPKLKAASSAAECGKTQESI